MSIPHPAPLARSLRHRRSERVKSEFKTEHGIEVALLGAPETQLIWHTRSRGDLTDLTCHGGARADGFAGGLPHDGCTDQMR